MLVQGLNAAASFPPLRPGQHSRAPPFRCVVFPLPLLPPPAAAQEREASARRSAAAGAGDGAGGEAEAGPSYEAVDPVSGTPLPLAPQLVTLSLLPRSQWDSLAHIEVIKARNKPLQPAKKPEAAPFFLPSLPGLDPNPVFDLSAAAGVCGVCVGGGAAWGMWCWGGFPVVCVARARGGGAVECAGARGQRGGGELEQGRQVWGVCLWQKRRRPPC